MLLPQPADVAPAAARRLRMERRFRRLQTQQRHRQPAPAEDVADEAAVAPLRRLKPAPLLKLAAQLLLPRPADVARRRKRRSPPLITAPLPQPRPTAPTIPTCTRLRHVLNGSY